MLFIFKAEEQAIETTNKTPANHCLLFSASPLFRTMKLTSEQIHTMQNNEFFETLAKSHPDKCFVYFYYIKVQRVHIG